jgi:hypothetical protein
MQQLSHIIRPISIYSAVTSRIRALKIVILAYQDINILVPVLTEKIVRYQETNVVSLISFLNITLSEVLIMHGVPICSCFAVLVPLA